MTVLIPVDSTNRDECVIASIEENKSWAFVSLDGGKISNVEFVDRGYYFTFDDTWTTENVTTTVDGAGDYPQATRNFLVGMTLNF